jgi:hypothetical protein
MAAQERGADNEGCEIEPLHIAPMPMETLGQ